IQSGIFWNQRYNIKSNNNSKFCFEASLQNCDQGIEQPVNKWNDFFINLMNGKYNTSLFLTAYESTIHYAFHHLHEEYNRLSYPEQSFADGYYKYLTKFELEKLIHQSQQEMQKSFFDNLPNR